MAFVHIDPNSLEAARQDQERLAEGHVDAIEAREHREQDLPAAKDRGSVRKPRSVLSRLRAFLHLGS